MRLFIAIQLTAEMKASLTDIQKQMRGSGIQGNYTPEENLHLTLAFIGEYPDYQEVLEILGEVRFTPFELELDGIGSFGDLWWAGICDSPALQAVVRRVRRALAEGQVPFDRKKFRAHITLLRKARMTKGIPPVEIRRAGMRVERISLMCSERGRNGMIYTELGSIQ